MGRWPYYNAAAALLRRCETTYTPSGLYHKPGGPASGFLYPSGIFPTCLESQTRKPVRTTSREGVPRSPLPHLAPLPALFLPASLPPHSPASLSPGPLRCEAASPPGPTALKQNSGGPWPGGPARSPSRALAGPESGSAEVASSASPALSREAQPQSPPGLPDGTICAPSGERRVWERWVPRKFSR